MSSASVVLPFVVEERVLALEALRVVEIVGRSRVVALPRTPTSLPGAIAWRGRAIALLELGPALGRPGLAGSTAHPGLRGAESRMRNLVIELRDDVVALGADRVLETLELAHPPQPSHAVELALPRLGEVELGDRLVSVLDLERWVEQLRRSA